MSNTDGPKQAVGITEPTKNDVEVLTVDEVFKRRIEQARKDVEELCIRRAKLEALNMSSMPYNQIRNLLEIYPF